MFSYIVYNDIYIWYMYVSHIYIIYIYTERAYHKYFGNFHLYKYSSANTNYETHCSWGKFDQIEWIAVK